MTQTTTFVGSGYWNNSAAIKAGPNLFNASDTSDLLHAVICLGFEYC